MAPRGKRKNEEGAEAQVLTKEDEAIAKFIRFNTPTQSTMFEGNEVHYFTGTKAVDTLFDSKYGTKAKNDPQFPDRKAAVRFLEVLIDKQLFFRARKLVPKKKEDKEKKEKAVESDAVKSDKKNKKEKEDTVNETEGEENEKKKEKEDDKKKKKVKLEVHHAQIFNDANDVYVWVFDPTPLYKKIIGLMMVLGTIAGCLFPLWPMWLRQGIYYLSLAGIGAFGAIVITAILRTILFGIIWLVTMGKHHLWILPNLTEDCGFFESFQPWYTYEYRPEGKAPKDDKKRKQDQKKGKKDKDSDDGKQPLIEENKEGSAEDQCTQDEDDSLSGNESGSGDTSSVPASPSEGKSKVRRRIRKADDDFVVVGN